MPAMKPTGRSVDAFLKAIPHEERRKDALALVKMLRGITRKEPKMWGSIVGFGEMHYKYASGHEGDMPLAAFAPGKAQMTIYLMPGTAYYKEKLAKLGPHKTGVSCLYVKRLADVDAKVLREVVAAAYRAMKTFRP